MKFRRPRENGPRAENARRDTTFPTSRDREEFVRSRPAVVFSRETRTGEISENPPNPAREPRPPRGKTENQYRRDVARVRAATPGPDPIGGRGSEPGHSSRKSRSRGAEIIERQVECTYVMLTVFIHYIHDARVLQYELRFTFDFGRLRILSFHVPEGNCSCVNMCISGTIIINMTLKLVERNKSIFP